MAAPMERTALCKTERKVLKKHTKSRQKLLKHDNIEVSELSTKILCVSNAGLDNGVSQEEVTAVFRECGQITEVVMLPHKPYCFVCFATVKECEKAYTEVNGAMFRKGKDTSQDVYFYTSYVSQVPPSVAPSKRLPPGLLVLPDFVTPECEGKLMEQINWKEDDKITDGQRTLKHRRVMHYGYEFKYNINNVDPNDPLPDGIPESCQEFLNRTLEIGVVKHFPDQLTINQYEPGHGIPPHVDTPSAFEDGLMSLSLGSQVVMDFRHPDGQHLSVLLPPRSMLVMTGESRYVWSHGITARKSDIVPDVDGGLTLVTRGTRTSFTFRKLTPLAGIHNLQSSPQEKESRSVPGTEKEAVLLEQEHVHQVYEEIAENFSRTRHRAWPKIAEFVRVQPTGTLLADIGCGNGKYLGENTSIYELGSDRCTSLAGICHERNFPVFVGDVLSIPLRSDTFDVCLCIAVIHHLSTPERRKRAITELLRILRPGGQLLIYVWAMEQERSKVKSKYLKTKMAESHSDNSQRDDIQDEAEGGHGCESGLCSDDNDAIPATREESICGESCKSNDGDKLTTKLSIHVNRTNFEEQDLLVPWQLKNQKSKMDNVEQTDSTTFHRFYHVFTECELEKLCESVGGSRTVSSYYDQGNWCTILEKLS